MKRKIFWIVYSLFFIALGFIYGSSHYDSLVSIFLYPFTFVGNNLRYLLLHNNFTLILGILLFMLITSWPMLYLLYRAKQNKVLPWEIILLSILSVTSVFVLLFFINPHIISEQFARVYQSTSYSVLQFAVSSVYYCIFFLYLGLRFINVKRNTTSNTITKVLFYVLISVIISNIIFQSVSSIIATLNNLDIKTVEAIIFVLRYIFQVTLSVAAIYVLNRLKMNFIRLNDGSTVSDSIKETKKLKKYSFIFIIIVLALSSILIATKFNLKSYLHDISFKLPVFEFTVFIIVWVISTYLIRTYKNTKSKK